MKNLKEALLTAIKMEHESIEFYAEAESKTSHSLGKKMFLSFIDDEKTHIRILRNMAEELLSSEDRNYLREKGPKGKLRTILKENETRLKQIEETNPNDIMALKIAMTMEMDGYEFYKQSAEKAQSPEVKTFILRLAKDEKDHFEILQNTLTLLESSGNWFLWEERGLLNGG